MTSATVIRHSQVTITKEIGREIGEAEGEREKD